MNELDERIARINKVLAETPAMPGHVLCDIVANIGRALHEMNVRLKAIEGSARGETPSS
jgi:hypothetical protein